MAHRLFRAKAAYAHGISAGSVYLQPHILQIFLNILKVKKFFRITLPMISPQLFFLLITITISSFKVFDMIQVMTDGGPGNATDVLVTYIYRYAFEMNAKVGYASAAGTILLLILMVLTFLYFRMLGRRVHYQ